MTDFNFPWEYNFPPFFTIQPNLETRKRQLEAWRLLILEYCLSKNVHRININEWLGKQPFCNDVIGRRLSYDSLKLIINSLVEKKSAEWETNETCLIYSQPLSHWADKIYAYVKSRGLKNSILTFYELLETEFNQLDETILLKALKILEIQGKATVIEQDGARGVKFA